MKKKTILCTLVGLCSMFFLTNCGGGGGGSSSDSPEPEGILTVSPSMLEIDANGQGTITVSSNTTWYVSSSDAWLECSPSAGSGSGQVTAFVYYPNTTGAKRSAILTFTDKSYAVTRTVTVIEKAGSTPSPDQELTVSPSSMTFAASGGSNSFNITSNLSWTVKSSESWCTVSPSSGYNNASITVTVSENPYTTSRSATITVKGGSITRTISVSQNAKGADDDVNVGRDEYGNDTNLNNK